jgi:hypothetical protein
MTRTVSHNSVLSLGECISAALTVLSMRRDAVQRPCRFRQRALDRQIAQRDDADQALSRFTTGRRRTCSSATFQAPAGISDRMVPVTSFPYGTGSAGRAFP